MHAINDARALLSLLSRASPPDLTHTHCLETPAARLVLLALGRPDAILLDKCGRHPLISNTSQRHGTTSTIRRVITPGITLSVFSFVVGEKSSSFLIQQPHAANGNRATHVIVVVVAEAAVGCFDGREPQIVYGRLWACREGGQPPMEKIWRAH